MADVCYVVATGVIERNGIRYGLEKPCENWVKFEKDIISFQTNYNFSEPLAQKFFATSEKSHNFLELLWPDF